MTRRVRRWKCDNPGKRTKLSGFRFDDVTNQRLDAICKRYNLNRTETLIAMIHDFADRVDAGATTFSERPTRVEVIHND